MPKCKQCGGFGMGLMDSGICAACEVENVTNAKKIKELQEEGHPYHCAFRQVWGDGFCECGLYQNGYDPYAWTDGWDATDGDRYYDENPDENLSGW